jgi:hypothetical protein
VVADFCSAGYSRGGVLIGWPAGGVLSLTLLQTTFFLSMASLRFMFALGIGLILTNSRMNFAAGFLKHE